MFYCNIPPMLCCPYSTWQSKTHEHDHHAGRIALSTQRRQSWTVCAVTSTIFSSTASPPNRFRKPFVCIKHYAIVAPLQVYIVPQNVSAYIVFHPGHAEQVAGANVPHRERGGSIEDEGDGAVVPVLDHQSHRPVEVLLLLREHVLLRYNQAPELRTHEWVRPPTTRVRNSSGRDRLEVYRVCTSGSVHALLATSRTWVCTYTLLPPKLSPDTDCLVSAPRYGQRNRQRHNS